jgi:hypothetical protein
MSCDECECGFAQMMKVGVQKVKVWTPIDETNKSPLETMRFGKRTPALTPSYT